ncbi:MAG: hypothetical protein GXP55_03105 [Deltaproteobacteria bacterium]|nr:hypothetical protein [Deltaproteobacteria bacterium]
MDRACLAALVGALLCAASASAQEPAPEPGTQEPGARELDARAPEADCTVQQRAPDVILLQDGTRLRGLIASTTPAETVLLLASGERRVLEASTIQQIRRARAASTEPERRPDADTSVVGEATQLHLRGSDDGGEPVTFYAVAGTRVSAPPRTDGMSNLNRSMMRLNGDAPQRGFWLLERLCTAPCDVDLAVGNYSLAVARGTAVPTLLGAPVNVLAETTLEARITSHAGSRWAFGLTFVGGILLGTSTMLAGFAAADDGAPNLPVMLSGLGLIVGALIGGMILAGVLDLDDDVDVRTQRTAR